MDLRLSNEEARYTAATLARQLDMCAQGRELMQTAGKPMTEEESRTWAMVNAEAIRQVLRMAGLSTDWHIGPGAPDGAASSDAQHRPCRNGR